MNDETPEPVVVYRTIRIEHALTYIIVPYSHPDKSMEAMRAMLAARFSAYLMNMGELVFCPIVHCRPIALAGHLPHSYEFWNRYNDAMLTRCQRARVLNLDGWKESKGVNGEIQFCLATGIPITHHHPETYMPVDPYESSPKPVSEDTV